MADPVFTHALVLPDADFRNWYNAVAAYLGKFDRVIVVRSPRGNDLNRFHTVTAVNAPGVWVANDALSHIRRAYPSVVRVDVVRANTPAELTAALQSRVNANDRLGEAVKDGHLFSRFAFRWMSDGRPAAIANRFGTILNGRPLEGIDVVTQPGAIVRAAITGTVVYQGYEPYPGYGTTIQINTQHVAQPGVTPQTTYTLIYANLGATQVGLGQQVQVGQQIGTASAATMRFAVQGAGGQTGLLVPNVLDPSPMIDWPELRVTPTADGVRIREKPGKQFKGLQQVYIGDLIEPLEPHGRTLEKLGREESWLRVRTPLNIEGYGAAWLLQALTRESSGVVVNMTGMNLDALHPLGKPSPERLSGLGWVRMPYKATPSQGFNTVEAAHQFYEPILRGYAQKGIKVILILTHQTYGEGGGYDWHEMYSPRRERWNDFIPPFIEVVRSIARRYAGKDLVHAYQIWNEQDTPFGSGIAAVSIQPEDCARLTAESVRAIRAVDNQVKVITGGHIGGPGPGAAYARQMIAAIPNNLRPDGIGVHSYGRGAPTSNPRYTSFGNIADDVNVYGTIMPDAPIWITEWGVLDMPDDDPAAISRYATEFLRYLKGGFRRRVATACWYAFADSMHNGYGLVDRGDRPKFPLYEQYLRA